jgi:hypothetical protein
MPIQLSEKDEAFVQQLDFGTVTPVELTGDPSCDRFIKAMNAMGAAAWEEKLKDSTRIAIAHERASVALPQLITRIDTQ